MVILDAAESMAPDDVNAIVPETCDVLPTASLGEPILASVSRAL